MRILIANFLSVVSLTSVLWSWLLYTAIWNTDLFDKTPDYISRFSWLIMAIIVMTADLLIICLCKKTSRLFLALSIAGLILFLIVQGLMMFLTIYARGV